MTVKRHRFVEKVFKLLADNIILFMINEAHFHLSGMANNQIFLCWASENPQELQKQSLQS